MMELSNEISFGSDGLIPAIIQDVGNGEVLMLGYMNRESLAKTIETGKTHFFSRSRKELWRKGETSGHEQEVKEIRLDCDGDTLLITVEQKGVACHTGKRSCFFRRVEATMLTPVSVGQSVWEEERSSAAILQKIFNVVLDRKRNPRRGSYTCELFDAGREKILKKIGEEALEVIIASTEDDSQQVIYEVSDLIYHVLVLLGFHDIPLTAIYEELESRYGR